jgi:hypothetical protein
MATRSAPAECGELGGLIGSLTKDGLADTIRLAPLTGDEITGTSRSAAYGSPALPLRPGIGPAADLAALGIVLSLDLPGVGSELADHPLAEIQFATSADAPSPLPAFQAMLTASSARARTGDHDLQVFPMSAGVAGPSVVSLFVSVTLPLSRGQVVTRELRPDAPIVERTGRYHHPVGTCRWGRQATRAPLLTTSAGCTGWRGSAWSTLRSCRPSRRRTRTSPR